MSQMMRKLQQIEDLAKEYFILALGAASGEQAYLIGQQLKSPEMRLQFYEAAILDLESIKNQEEPLALGKTVRKMSKAVDVRTFVEDKYFLDAKNVLYPAVMDALIEINSGKYVEAVLTGGIGCVDKDTECLTPTGWVKIGEYSGQKIAQYHLDGTMDFVLPSNYVKYPCQEFLRFKTKYGIDMALSPEHRVLYLDKANNPKEISAQKMWETHGENTRGFRGKFITSFSPRLETSLPYSDIELQVMIMAMAAGHFPAHLKNTYCVVRVKKQRKIERARALLSLYGRVWKETKSAEYSLFKFHAPLREKSMGWMWGASAPQLQLIAKETLYWDGSVSKHQFYSRDKKSADFIQYAFTSIGKRAVLETIVREDGTDYVVRGNDNTLITMMGTPKTKMQKVASEDGYKYCFTVPTSYWVARRNGKVFVTGNTGKTTLAVYTTAYQLYLLSLESSPQRMYGLDPRSEIVLIFQSLNAKLAKDVDYKRFQTMLEASQYFKDNFPFDKDITSKLVFPNRIEVRPVSGVETATIGQNIIGGVIDEVNFMAYIDNSKMSSEKGTAYDQAWALYTSIASRRKSRFMKKGNVAGMLCLVSSKRYPGQFTDKKEEESIKEKLEIGKTSIFIFDKRVWDVKPKEDFTGGWFRVFVGDENRKPRVLAPDEYIEEADAHLVDTVPMEYAQEFDRNIMQAIREVCGRSTWAVHPFITDTIKIVESTRKTNIMFGRETVDFVNYKLDIDISKIINPKLPRFVHCDLAVSGDSAGFAIGTVPKFVTIDRGGEVEVLPYVHIDAALEISPPKGGEIQLWKVREIIYALTQLGVNIKWVTFDQFQSVDGRQLLAQKGYMVGIQSVDITTAPYDFVKSAMYDGRLSIPEHKVLVRELSSLERDMKKNKINHPPSGSKDVSDAVAGVTYGLTMRREIWAMHRIPLGKIPQSILDVIKAKEKKEEQKLQLVA